jgi:peptidoglycan-associated lipoprotein
MNKLMELYQMKLNRGVILIAAAVLSLGAGCAKKKVATATPPATPPPVQQPAARPAAQPTRAAQTPAPAPAAAPRSNMPDAATRAHIDQLLARIEDAYFDYNQHTLRPDAIAALKKDSTELRDILKDYPDYKLTIEGHADERGSAEYNMTLAQARAEAAKEYLVGIGIPSGQLGLISYGKEKPVCSEHDEPCWQKNRRIHIVANATRE